MTLTPSRHDAAVADLVGRYRALPPGARVRLAKKTSNLFRFDGADSAGTLDASALAGVISVDDVARPPRCRA
jgi:hypothetical protein